MTYQLTSALLGFTLAVVILWLIYKDHMHTRHAFWWMAVAVTVFVLGFFPNLVDWLGLRLGVAYPPVLALVAAIGVLLVKLLLMDIENSRQERALRRLIQRMALLEAELKRSRE
ncbi:hypothetical protein MIT9_P0505 [Methylomarinovum caldicuralii]|uniref:DUF2304 domain-containing protein n=1 Tax=Methylomarinovum caldicuralii TaxID=438856 RepID=A0AAU9BY08_9GAMM|nr:DUF2304 domain-containing protein [Methylomarinovum caldicuralii]BCX80927.1 hypothetical protein MIT9_P0505 [Methylomarinovum caldicuralii]